MHATWTLAWKIVKRHSNNWFIHRIQVLQWDKILYCSTWTSCSAQKCPLAISSLIHLYLNPICNIKNMCTSSTFQLPQARLWHQKTDSTHHVCLGNHPTIQLINNSCTSSKFQMPWARIFYQKEKKQRIPCALKKSANWSKHSHKLKIPNT